MLDFMKSKLTNKSNCAKAFNQVMCLRTCYCYYSDSNDICSENVLECVDWSYEECGIRNLFLIFKIVFISVDIILDTNLIEWRVIVVH